jgi:hypothetical protein
MKLFYENVFVSRSGKPIIDDIDGVLDKHYGD